MDLAEAFYGVLLMCPFIPVEGISLEDSIECTLPTEITVIMGESLTALFTELNKFRRPPGLPQ